MKKKLDIYSHINLISYVEMVLLICVLAVVIYAVGFVTSPGWSIIFPPTVSLVMWVSDFCGLMPQTILPYFTFRYFWACDFGMKNIVFDTATLLTTVGIYNKSMGCLIENMKTVKPIFSRDWSYHFTLLINRIIFK